MKNSLTQKQLMAVLVSIIKINERMTVLNKSIIEKIPCLLDMNTNGYGLFIDFMNTTIFTYAEHQLPSAGNSEKIEEIIPYLMGLMEKSDCGYNVKFK